MASMDTWTRFAFERASLAVPCLDRIGGVMLDTSTRGSRGLDRIVKLSQLSRDSQEGKTVTNGVSQQRTKIEWKAKEERLPKEGYMP